MEDILLSYLDRNGILLCNREADLPCLEDIGCAWGDVTALLDCCRAIIQSGIKMVVTHEVKIDKSTPQNTWRDKLGYSEQMFREAGIEVKYLPQKE